MTSTQAGEGRIVVGVDGSGSSVAALAWAVRQGELTGSRVEAMISWHWPMSYGYPMPVPQDYDPSAEATKVLEEAVAKVRQEQPGVEIGTTVVEGAAGPALVAASKGAGLLVVGNRGHGEMAGLLLGSVSEYCVAHAHCPVLVFRA